VRLAERIRRSDLPGSAEMAALFNPHAPTATIVAALRAGLDDPPKTGNLVPQLTAAMLERGAGARNRLELAHEVENHGLSLDCYRSPSSPSLVYVVIRGLSEEFPRMVRILASVLRQPRFDGEELEKLKEKVRGLLRQELTEPYRVSSGLFSRMVFPQGHPFHRKSVEDRAAEVESIRAEEIRDFHSRVYGTASLKIVSVGAVNVDEAHELIGESFDGWRTGRTDDPPLPEMPENGPARRASIDLPDRPNLDVIMGHAAGLLRNHEDYIPAMLANACLGQSTLTSRLGLSVRDTAGLTYGINSSFSGVTDIPGSWTIHMGVSADNLDRAINLTMTVLRDYLTEGPSEEEFRDEQLSWAGSYRVGLAGNSGLARQILTLLTGNLPLEEIDDFPERILRCTRQECLDSLTSHFHPEILVTAVAGSIRKDDPLPDSRGPGA